MSYRSRDAVQRLDLKQNITPVGEAITRRALALSAGTPFDVRSVAVANIQYPAEVTDALSQKLTTSRALAGSDTPLRIGQNGRLSGRARGG